MSAQSRTACTPVAKQSRWLPSLHQLFPKGIVSVEPAALEQHAKDAWWATALPDAVVLPRTEAQVIALMKFAHAHRIPVTPRGAGRGYVGGCVPVRGGIVLSLARMKRVLELNLVDGVARVQPGVITAQFQDLVKSRGWFYPPDPASRLECSLGGNVGTNAGGPRCLKYGVTRNYVLGLRVVLADGTLVPVGGRTHKNKTGFDLVGMFVGSEGMLGVVTEITLRLLPHPPTRGAVSAVFPRAEQAAEAVNAIFAQGLLPAALEVADAFTLAAARKHLGTGRVPAGDAHVLVEVDGSAEAVKSEIGLLAKLLKQVGATEIKTALDDAGCERLWEMRRGFSGSLKASGLTKMNEDIVVPRSRLVDLFRFAQKLERKHGMRVASFGHAGDGNIHVNIMADLTQPGEQERVERALDELFRQVVAWGGSITGEHGVGLAKKRWWELATTPSLRELHALIKGAVDPMNLLNPGKFLDG